MIILTAEKDKYAIDLYTNSGLTVKEILQKVECSYNELYSILDCNNIPRRYKEKGLRVCEKCGNKVKPDAKYCDQCGAPIPKDKKTVALQNLNAIQEFLESCGYPVEETLLGRCREIESYIKSNKLR